MTMADSDAAAVISRWLDDLVVRGPQITDPQVVQAKTVALLDALDRPQRHFPLVHLAGSKGKGSTALLLEAILLAAGYRVGTFTSPHLHHWCERIRLHGHPLSRSAFVALFDQVRPPAERVDVGFFPVTLAAALTAFARAQVDVAIVEAGVGGLRDASYVLDGHVTCLTAVEWEHVDKLGPTIGHIARDKAALARPKRPCILGALSAEADAAARQVARDRGAQVIGLGREVQWRGEDHGLASAFALADDRWRFSARVNWPGRQFAHNAALAVLCARALGLHDGELATAATQALQQIQLPGRCELLGKAPWLLVDGAHTEQSALALAQVLRHLPAKPRHGVLALSRDKSPTAVFGPLLPYFDQLTTTQIEPRRGWSAGELAQALADTGRLIRIAPDAQTAVLAAQRMLPPDGLLCATGSVYLAGAARAWLKPSTGADES